MFKFLGAIFENHFMQASMALAGFGSLISDAYFGNIGFVISLVLAIGLLLWAFVDEYQHYKVFNNEILPIPVVISIDDVTPLPIIFSSIVSKIEDDTAFKDLEKYLEKYFHIHKDMLMFKYNGSMYDTGQLLSFFNVIRYQLNHVEKRLNNKVQFHVAYLRRPALAIAMGGMFRTDGIVVYQNNDHKDCFDKVATIDSRQYKEKVDSFKKFDVTYNIKEEEDDTYLIFIQISSHLVTKDHPEFDHFKNIITITSKGNGTIGQDEDWVRYSQEIYTVINQLNVGRKSITLVHSMPEAVGIILGMALENYWHITITQFDQSDYKNVITLNSIKYLS